jgi:hypothetical protein
MKKLFSLAMLSLSVTACSSTPVPSKDSSRLPTSAQLEENLLNENDVLELVSNVGRKFVRAQDLIDRGDERAKGNPSAYLFPEEHFAPMSSTGNEFGRVYPKDAASWQEAGINAGTDFSKNFNFQKAGFSVYYETASLQHACTARYVDDLKASCGGEVTVSFRGLSCALSLANAKTKNAEVAKQFEVCDAGDRVSFSSLKEDFRFVRTSGDYYSAHAPAPGALACIKEQLAQLDLAFKSVLPSRTQELLQVHRAPLSFADKIRCAAGEDKEKCDSTSARVLVRLYDFTDVRSATLESAAARAGIGDVQKLGASIPVISVNAVFADGDCRVLDAAHIAQQLGLSSRTHPVADR